MRTVFTLVLFIGLTAASGCTTTFDTAYNYHKQGNYQQAYNYYVQCANEGESSCINNIGVLYENRRMTTDEPLEIAIRYYTLAARYGSQHARTSLARLGQSIPPADLERQLSETEQRMLMESAGDLGKALGRLLR